MIQRPNRALDLGPATDGTIAVLNLESTRLQGWSRFWRLPGQPGIAEIVVEQELLTAQFCGDQGAFDRLESLVNQLGRGNAEAARTSLIPAHVACATHRFADARVKLAQATAYGAPSDAAERLLLSLDQATGVELERVLATRRRRAALDCWEELVPLGALLADLGEFDEAEWTYHRALREYQNASPFALAWVCFELGVLWGERVSAARLDLAEHWYRIALEYLSGYVKARVHLAEILLDRGATEEAGHVLRPVMTSGDPEVYWRLAKVAEAAGNAIEAEALVETARLGFESLLSKHLLAFADHGTEFYLADGRNPARAFELARANLANRPTPRAFELAAKAALAAGRTRFAEDLVAAASQRWARSTLCRDAPPAADIKLGASPDKAGYEPSAASQNYGNPRNART